MNMPDDRPPFDRKRAESFIGKHVLIGLTYYDHKGTFLEQRQLHGRILRADAKKGFEIRLFNQKEELFWLPPDLRGFFKARPGEYTLKSTGEVVMNPDLICNWIVNKEPPSNETGTI